MKIPFLSSLNKDREYTFGLFLKEEEGIGIVLQKTQEGIISIDKEKFRFSNGWENLTEDVDELLVNLERRVNTHFSNTIFFIYSHILDHNTNEIKKEQLLKIKDLVKKLDLKAMGYIECNEAVVKILEEKEETPFTGIAVELDNHFASIFVYKVGKVMQKTSITRTQNLLDDLKSTFSLMSEKMLLPGKIVLYNSRELDKEATAIVGHKWDERIFIQIPKVEIVSEDQLISGLIKVFESQVNKERVATSGQVIENERDEVLGFVIGKDVKSMKKEPTSDDKPRPSIKKPSFEGLVKVFTRVKMLFSKATISVYVIAGLFIILLSLTINEVFLHTARLKVFLPSQEIKKEVDLQSITVGDDELGLKVSTDSAEFSQTVETTGEREVGEKARGEVTVYSFDDKSRLISKDSILVFEGLKFITASDVQVASASEALVSGNLVKQPGKNKVSIIAAEIGSQGNLDKGKRLQFENLSPSTYFAINDNAFTGGTKKNIRTVSKKDVDEANKKIMNESKKNQVSEQKVRAKDNARVIEQLSKVELEDSTLSHEIGEESNELTVKAKALSTSYLFDEKKLIKLLIENVKDELKKGFGIPPEKISYKIKEASDEQGEVSLVIDVKAKALQIISKEDLSKNFVLKSKKEVEKLLKERYGVLGYELTIRQPIPLINNFMPIRAGNIQVEVSAM